jgi:hypothetical protein
LVHGLCSNRRIIRELEKLTAIEKYNGTNQIVATNGTGMNIHNVGYAVIHTPTRDLHLNNVLHVPSASKNLIFVHRFFTENNASLEYFPNHFLIKDLDTSKVLLQGKCRDDLYPIPISWRQVLGAFKLSLQLWHNRLGHPSFHIVNKLVKDNNLICSSELESQHVCDSCQRAKSHQLSYHVSTSVSSKPLERIFSGVWGPTPNSVGRKKYYVSFIDDFSKFTWVYLFRFKFEVFQKFIEFQTMVECLFNTKLIAIQIDGGGEYQKMNSSWLRRELSITCRALVHINKMVMPRENIDTS